MKLRMAAIGVGVESGVLGATNNKMVLTTQGCTLACSGCCSTFSWDPTGGVEVDTQAILHYAAAVRPSGVVLTGGDPVEQYLPALEVLTGFRALIPEGEIVLYTGRSWSRLQRDYPALLATIDVAVCGPYVEALPPTPLAGSSNQTVHLITPLAQQLYTGWESWPLHKVQVVPETVKSKEIVMYGIPTRRLKAAATASSFECGWAESKNQENCNE